MADKELIDIQVVEEEDIFDKEKRDRISAIYEFLLRITKASRAFKLYDEKHRLLTLFVDELVVQYEKAAELCGGNFSIEVKPMQMLFEEEVVYEHKIQHESFAFKLFRDGVRLLAFSSDIERSELENLLDIIGTNFDAPDYRDEDIVTLLWKAEFKKIGYLATDGFTDMLSGGNIDLATHYLEVVSQILGEDLVGKWKGGYAERFGSPEDGEMGTPGAEAEEEIGSSEAGVEDPDLDDLLKGRVREVEAEIKIEDLYDKASDRLLSGNAESEETTFLKEHLETEDSGSLLVEYAESAMSLLTTKKLFVSTDEQIDIHMKLIDMSLRIGEPKVVMSLADAFVQFRPSKQSIPDAPKIKGKIITRLKEREMAVDILTSYTTHDLTVLDWFKRFYMSDPTQDISWIWEAFKGSSLPSEAVTALTNMATETMTIDVDKLIEQLKQVSETSAVPILTALSKSADKKVIELFFEVARWEDANVRAAAITKNPSGYGSRMRELVLDSLKDHEPIVRDAAINKLVSSRDSTSCIFLIHLLRNPVFSSADSEEYEKVFMAIARLGKDRYLKFLRKQLGSPYPRLEKILDTILKAPPKVPVSPNIVLKAIASVGTDKSLQMLKKFIKTAPPDLKGVCTQVIRETQRAHVSKKQEKKELQAAEAKKKQSPPTKPGQAKKQPVRPKAKPEPQQRKPEKKPPTRKQPEQRAKAGGPERKPGPQRKPETRPAQQNPRGQAGPERKGPPQKKQQTKPGPQRPKTDGGLGKKTATKRPKVPQPKPAQQPKIQNKHAREQIKIDKIPGFGGKPGPQGAKGTPVPKTQRAPGKGWPAQNKAEPAVRKQVRPPQGPKSKPTAPKQKPQHQQMASKSQTPKIDKNNLSSTFLQFFTPEPIQTPTKRPVSSAKSTPKRKGSAATKKKPQKIGIESLLQSYLEEPKKKSPKNVRPSSRVRKPAPKPNKNIRLPSRARKPAPKPTEIARPGMSEVGGNTVFGQAVGKYEPPEDGRAGHPVMGPADRDLADNPFDTSEPGKTFQRFPVVKGPDRKPDKFGSK